MKKTIVSMFETGMLHLVVLCLIFEGLRDRRSPNSQS